MMRLLFQGVTAVYVFGTKGVYYGNYTGTLHNEVETALRCWGLMTQSASTEKPRSLS